MCRMYVILFCKLLEEVFNSKFKQPTEITLTSNEKLTLYILIRASSTRIMLFRESLLNWRCRLLPSNHFYPHVRVDIVLTRSHWLRSIQSSSITRRHSVMIARSHDWKRRKEEALVTKRVCFTVHSLRNTLHFPCMHAIAHYISPSWKKSAE